MSNGGAVAVVAGRWRATHSHRAPFDTKFSQLRFCPKSPQVCEGDRSSGQPAGFGQDQDVILLARRPLPAGLRPIPSDSVVNVLQRTRQNSRRKKSVYTCTICGPTGFPQWSLLANIVAETPKLAVHTLARLRNRPRHTLRLDHPVNLGYRALHLPPQPGRDGNGHR